MAKRAALGIELRATGTRRDTLGVFVEAVTPKGPAETAGIIEGDRIAAINGVDLRTAGGDVDDPYTNGLAAHRLTREVQKLAPGARVTLRVYSGGRFRDVQVTAGKASDLVRLGGRFRFPGSEGMMEFNGPGAAMMFGPDMPMLRQQIEPLVRERLNRVPNKVQLRRSPLQFIPMAPTRVPRVFKVEGGQDTELVPGRALGDYEDMMMFDLDDPLFDIENEIGQVSPAVIRDLAATAIRDAQSALKRLAADGVV
ncbi:MAG: PDZ domain-containing protein [Gemmatimonadota bacterium]|nr:PDZ domain-containing protein [Gemmatimonadota bacterium]